MFVNMVTIKVEATTMDIIKHTGSAIVDIISTTRPTFSVATILASQTTHLYFDTYQFAICLLVPDQEDNSHTDLPADAQPEHMAGLLGSSTA